MSAPWGPALDAEVAYRQEQVRSQFGRRNRRRFRRAASAAPPAAAVTTTTTITTPAPAAIPLQRAGVDATDGAPASTLSTAGRAGSPTARRAA